MNILWRYVMAYWDYYGVEYKMNLTSMIVRWPSSHIINCSLTHSPTPSIDQSIDQSIDGSKDMLPTLNFTLFYDGKIPGRFTCVFIGNTMITYYTFLLIRYCCKLPRYICFIQPCWTKKISGICIIRIISIIFFQNWGWLQTLPLNLNA